MVHVTTQRSTRRARKRQACEEDANCNACLTAWPVEDTLSACEDYPIEVSSSPYRTKVDLSLLQFLSAVLVCTAPSVIPPVFALYCKKTMRLDQGKPLDGDR